MRLVAAVFASVYVNVVTPGKEDNNHVCAARKDLHSCLLESAMNLSC